MRTLITLTVLLAALLAGPAAEAQGRGDGRGEARSQLEQRIDDVRARIEALIDEFDLTAQQEIQILLVLESALPEARTVIEAMADNRDAIANALRAEPTDAATIEALAADQGSLSTDLARIRADALIDIRATLTDEQLGLISEVEAAIRAEAAEFAAAAQARSQGRIARRAALRGRFPGTGDRLSALADEFGLSAAQRAEVRGILQSSAPAALEVIAGMAANREAIKDAISAEPVDRAAVDALTEAQGVLFAEGVLLRVDTFDRIRAVLTDEQLDMLEALRAALAARIGTLVSV